MGTSKAVGTMPPEKKKMKKRVQEEEVVEEEPPSPQGGPQRAQRRAFPESAGTGVHKDGRILSYITPEGRSSWFCRYGWLVKDVVGDSPETMVANCRARTLGANALFLLHVLILAGLLGSWADSSGSANTAQLGAALAVTALWTQYVLALRPWASMLVVLVELVPSCMEMVVLVMALLQAAHASMSTPPSTVCMVLLFVEVAFVALVEFLRTVVVISAMFSASTSRNLPDRQTKVRDNPSAGGGMHGGGALAGLGCAHTPVCILCAQVQPLRKPPAAVGTQQSIVNAAGGR